MRSLTFDRIIGNGAMGTVYRASLHDGQGGTKLCAVKVMKGSTPDLEQFRARMRDEARLLGLLRDERILGVSEMLVVDGCDCVVMDFIEGIDLTDLVRNNPMPPKALASLGAELSATLHRAHEAVHPTTGEPLKVIHRDIKPSNIMITREGALRLLDFSVARAVFSSRESQTQGLVLGTLNYFPPEILAGAEPTAAVDLYGLGLTLWECASGKDWGNPQVHRHRFERRVEQRLGELGSPYEMLVPIFRQLLAWRPDDRPDGAAAEKLLASAALASPGPPLARWAAETVPALLEKRNTTQESDARVGRTLRIDSATDVRATAPQARKLERIDPLLAKARQARTAAEQMPTVTETFNDLAPPAAVVRTKRRPVAPSAQIAASSIDGRADNRAPIEPSPRFDEASITQLETEAIKRPRSSRPPDDSDELPLDPTTSEVPTVAGIEVTRSQQSVTLPTPLREPEIAVSAAPTLIHAESMVRPAARPQPRPAVERLAAPEHLVTPARAAPERPKTTERPRAQHEEPFDLRDLPADRGPSFASTAALLFAAAMFGASVGVTLLLGILFLGWFAVG